MDNNIKEHLENMLKNNLFAVVYPKDKSEETAKKIALEIDSAVGVAAFEDENGETAWGVLIDKIKEVQKNPELMKKIQEKKKEDIDK